MKSIPMIKLNHLIFFSIAVFLEKTNKCLDEAQIIAFMLRADKDGDGLVRFSEFMDVCLSKENNRKDEIRAGSPESSTDRQSPKLEKEYSGYLSHLKDTYASSSKRSPSPIKVLRSAENFFSPKSTQASFTLGSSLKTSFKPTASKVTFDLNEYVKTLSNNSFSISTSQNTEVLDSIKKNRIPTTYKEPLQNQADRKENLRQDVSKKENFNFEVIKKSSPIRETPNWQTTLKENNRETPSREDGTKSNQAADVKMLKRSKSNIGVIDKELLKKESQQTIEEEAHLVKTFKEIIEHIQRLESIKNDLAEKKDFNMFNAFTIFDVERKGSINRKQLQQGLLKLNIKPSSEEVYLFMKRLDEDSDGSVR